MTTSRVVEHLSWMRGQYVRGTVLISGPSADGAVGIYVLCAPSREDADALAATDPLAQDDQPASRSLNGMSTKYWGSALLTRRGCCNRTLVRSYCR